MNTLKRAAKWLKRLEWQYQPYDECLVADYGYHCPECGNEKSAGHARNCELITVITELESLAQAEPVAGQCKFSCESKWLPCSVEHHRHVLSCPEEWPGHETRLLYTAPQPSVPPGWKLVPMEPTSKMIVAGAEADPQFFTHAQFVYRAMLAAVPEQEGGAA
ncbi:hypothetical protein LH426_15725 [Laribacter hongkongensis]|uniref:hypothetical protein n=1 Tax=Laribacter hongkongensis TaxID=168471 RepID=UPI001EFE4A42|nr:hypothetical protein [Laribacter hongkongensis]MCG9005894.1 hypothetical protein [Laribacter hongkongensis]MCG9030439.1 hypothetical protein [Laribacter hongkongensis]MCG9036340.1 hypothetical protein [Laribacter hongkongensis]MCG9039341.1 hypothetical protein [Laribacter hongkongensis]MCG9045434.1 hypothetical protein [Laribacter hongkongensis]